MILFYLFWFLFSVIPFESAVNIVDCFFYDGAKVISWLSVPSWLLNASNNCKNNIIVKYVYALLYIICSKKFIDQLWTFIFLRSMFFVCLIILFNSCAQIVFQIALKVLEDNRQDLLASNDDGEAMTVLSDYLSSVVNHNDSSFISYGNIVPEIGKKVCLKFVHILCKNNYS